MLTLSDHALANTVVGFDFVQWPRIVVESFFHGLLTQITEANHVTPSAFDLAAAHSQASRWPIVLFRKLFRLARRHFAFTIWLQKMGRNGPCSLTRPPEVANRARR